MWVSALDERGRRRNFNRVTIRYYYTTKDSYWYREDSHHEDLYRKSHCAATAERCEVRHTQRIEQLRIEAAFCVLRNTV